MAQLRDGGIGPRISQSWNQIWFFFFLNDFWASVDTIHCGSIMALHVDILWL